MPSQAANAAALRADGHKLQVYLSAMVDTANPVLVGALSSTPSASSALNLAYTTSSGSSANVRRGMRVVIETAGGVYKGTLSVRFAGTISSTNLPVREFSEGHVQTVSSDVLKVYNDFVLTDRLVAATETFDPDYETYTDQNGTVKPIPTSGGHWAGWIDSGQTYATITLYGAESYTIDEDSAGSVTHVWTLPSGVAFAPGSSSTDVSPTIRADVGYYVIQHDVTDSTNSKADVQYVFVRVHDTAHFPYDITLDAPIAGEPARGFGFAVSLYENAELSTLPDLCPVILWARETINGTVQSFGAKVSGRSHILCVGYLRRDQFSMDSTGASPVRFEVVSPLARLFELPGFSKVMDRMASPAGWSEVEALTVKRGIVLLLRYYTNAPQLFDIVFDGFDDANYPALYLQKKTPADQASELVDSRGARLAADHSGRMEIQQRLDLTPIADRAAVTTTFTLTTDDCLQVDVEREHVRPVETHHTRGYTAGTTTAEALTVFAKWAASPGSGASSPVTERLIVDSVPDLYEQAAMRGAAEDRVYFDSTGKQYHAPRVTVTLPGAYWGLFRFYREYVLLDLDETTNGRGIDLSIFKFIPVSAELDVSGGTGRVKVVLQAAAYAEGAVDDTPPDNGITLPPYEPPNTPTLTGSLIPGAVSYTASSMALITANGIAKTGNFQSASPEYTFTSWASLSVSGTFRLWIPNGFAAGSGWVVTSTNIYYGSLSTLSFTSKYTFGTASTLASADASFSKQNHFVVVRYLGSGGGMEAVYTTDNSTFTSVTVSSHYTTAATPVLPACCIDSRGGQGSKVYTSAHTTTSAGVGVITDGQLLVSSDYGATWGALSPDADTDIILAQNIHIPYGRSGNPVILYNRGIDFTATGTRLYRRIDSTDADIAPNDGTYRYAPFASRNNIATAISNPNRGLFVLVSATSGAGYSAFLTNDLLATSPTWITIEANTDYRGCALAGDNSNVGWLWGTSNAIAQIGISGATVTAEDKSGNLASLSVGDIEAIGGY